MNLGIRPQKILFIFRNPVDAILSHIPPRQFSGEDLQTKIALEMGIWSDLILLYVRTPLKCRSIIYDDLISDDLKSYNKSLMALCEVFEEEIDTNRLFEVINSYEEMKKISASGKGEHGPVLDR